MTQTAEVENAMQTANKTKGNGRPVATALAKAKKKGTLVGLNSQDVKTVLSSVYPQIEKALPKHLTPERMIQMATTLVVRNPKLMECSVKSFIGAVMQASILGFPPAEDLGLCYFVPYKGQVSFQIGYKGYIRLAQQSGEVKMIYAAAVREDDHFVYSLGLDPKLEHNPSGNTKGRITHSYAVAHYKSGGYNFIVLTRGEIEDLRMRSPGQGPTPTGAWKTDYAKMSQAKAIKQMSPYLPLSIDTQEVIVNDEKPIKLSDDERSVEYEEIDYETINIEPEPEQKPEKKPKTRKKPTKKEAEKKPEPKKETDPPDPKEVADQLGDPVVDKEAEERAYQEAMADANRKARVEAPHGDDLFDKKGGE